MNFCLHNFIGKYKSAIIVIALMCLVLLSFAQKPVLDTSVFREWPMVNEGRISDDGRYITYIINHVGSGKQKDELVIQSVSGDWKKVFVDYNSEVYFSPDCKKAYVGMEGDSLLIIDLGLNKIGCLKNIMTYKILEDRIYYRRKDNPDVLILRNLSNGREINLDDISDYLVNEQKNLMILVKKHNVDSFTMAYYDLKNRISVEFWRGKNLRNLVPNHDFDAISFIGDSENDSFGIYWYDFKTNVTQLLIANKKIDIDSNLEIKDIFRFTNDNRSLLFSVGRKIHSVSSDISSKIKPNVSIWSYKDVILRSELDMVGLPKISNSIYLVNLVSKNVLEVTHGNEDFYSQEGNYAIIKRKSGLGNSEEGYWNPQSQISYFLISLSDGHRESLSINNPILSRGGHYILYYEPQSCDLYTYETSTGKTYNITRNITRKGIPENAKYNSEFTVESTFGNYWLDNDTAVMVYGERDLWMLSSRGNNSAINLTNGYGARENIVFRAVNNISAQDFYNKKGVVFTGFNLSTKDNGFFKVNLNQIGDPRKLVMDKYVFYIPNYPVENGYNNKPVKAKNCDVWLIKRMKSNESPNYFVTKDFKCFSRITSLYPEKDFNWMSTELHTWKTFNGDLAQGILYKPENFDPHKKYPVIFHYYMQFSCNLNSYLQPAVSIGPINIPWYVSHGYLVFVPDIVYTPGATGRSAYNSVVSAALHLKSKAYVDSTKMALQGHSFGGYETNYILTQTSIFAAACSSSGVTDLVSFAGLLGSYGRSNHFMASSGQIGMAVRLWDDPKRYIENSPLFYLNNITTPFLVMHTTEDKAVNITQALELFTGLRQFKKKVWLLIYDGEDHILMNYNNALDYTERQTQFFDFYLKGKEEPEWMRTGIH